MTTPEVRSKNGLSLSYTPDLCDRKQILDRLEALRREWKEGTHGRMKRVTINLELLFEDFERVITGEEV